MHAHNLCILTLNMEGNSPRENYPRPHNDDKEITEMKVKECAFEQELDEPRSG